MKYIFVTGGVCSSLGKGVTAASIACLLEHANYRVGLLKLDPYLNLDPGTMSPAQHGEVYVTKDGAETDLDLGTYQRFTENTSFSRLNSVSTGQIYEAVLRRERSGGYQGKTVQIIPHITDEIKTRIKLAGEGTQILIVEIGGTVGDIESVPFLEAIRQFSFDVGRNNVIFIHLTLVPWLSGAGEAKTKPTQHSVKELMQTGIVPDILICRSIKDLSSEMKEKLALFCNVGRDAVFTARDIDSTIYEVPLIYEKQGLLNKILTRLELQAKKLDLEKWRSRVERLLNPAQAVTIVVCSNSKNPPDAQKSVFEALAHAGAELSTRINIVRLDSDALLGLDERDTLEFLDSLYGDLGSFLKTTSGILLSGNDLKLEGLIRLAQFARKNKIPCLGINLGMHAQLIEFARDRLGYRDANYADSAQTTSHPVIIPIAKSLIQADKTRRLGLQELWLAPNSKISQAYSGAVKTSERYRQSHGFSDKYRVDFENAGILFSVLDNDGQVEGFELKNSAWYIGLQAHPEFKTRLANPSPIFVSFVRAALETQKALGDDVKD